MAGNLNKNMMQSLSICSSCRSKETEEACICDDQATLLCGDCLFRHAKIRFKSHYPVSPEIGLRIQQLDPKMRPHFIRDLKDALNLINELDRLNEQNQDFMKRLKRYKFSVYSEFDKFFEEIFQGINSSLKEINEKKDLTNSYIDTWDQRAMSLIEDFRKTQAVQLYSDLISDMTGAKSKFKEYLSNFIMEGINQSQPFISDLKDEYPYMDSENMENLHKKLQDELSKTQDILRERDMELQQLRERFKESLADYIPKNLKHEDIPLTIQRISNEDIQLSPLLLPSEMQNQNPVPMDIEKVDIKEYFSLDQAVQFEGYLSKQYLYIPEDNSKNLIQYDVINKTYKTIELKVIDHEFCHTSSYEMPNGDVVITGNSVDVDDAVYLFQPSTNKCVRLANLREPRFYVSLCYYSNYLYAFGGRTSVRTSCSAERYNILNNYSHEPLKDMKHRRDAISSVAYNSKIYLFYGNYHNIEVYDITRSDYEYANLSHGDPISDCSISTIYNDMIYLIACGKVYIYDLELKFKDSKQLRSSYTYSSTTNVVTDCGKIYFYNNYTSLLEVVTLSMDQDNSHRLQSDSNQSYILYKLNENTQEILKINTLTKTVEFIDCSNDLVDKYFSYTSICLLPDNDIFIAGFYEPFSRNCYKFYARSKTISQDQPLREPRYCISLLYHNECIYAFGGRNKAGYLTKTAYVLKPNKRWEPLPNMTYERSGASSIGIKDKIYIIAGYQTSIEIYDIETSMYFVAEVTLPRDFVISCKINDSIYIIGDSFTMLLDKKCVQRDSRDVNGGPSTFYSLTNVAVCGDIVYYYKSHSYLLESLDTISLRRNLVEINH
jgi:hypothetical protein